VIIGGEYNEAVYIRVRSSEGSEAAVRGVASLLVSKDGGNGPRVRLRGKSGTETGCRDTLSEAGMSDPWSL